MTLALDVIEWAEDSPRGSYPRDLWREILRLRHRCRWHPMSEQPPACEAVLLVRSCGVVEDVPAEAVRTNPGRYTGWAYLPDDEANEGWARQSQYAVAGVEADGGYDALGPNQESRP